MKYYIIAGEASGDLHGSNLVTALRQSDPQASIRCWGGDLMEAAGATLVKHYRDLAFMGFTEVLANLPAILKNLQFCKADITRFHPDVLILIDYPGFNMRIARFARKAGFRIFYYISPQIWAWKQNRAYAIKRLVDRMFVILPFEPEFYARFGMEVSFVGHPLLDAVMRFKANPAISFPGSDSRPILALLPGSRKQEVSKVLPLMLEAVRELNFRIIIAGAPSLDQDFYREYLKGTAVEVVYNQTYSLLAAAHVAAVTSGTATLETALFGVPEVVCYKGSPISYWLARKLVKVNYISLVNLILDKPAVPELIQHELTPNNLRKQLSDLAGDTPQRASMLRDYSELADRLGGEGASVRTAREMVKRLRAFNTFEQ